MFFDDDDQNPNEFTRQPEKDWINRMFQIEILYKTAEKEHEIELERNKSSSSLAIASSFRSMLGWNSKNKEKTNSRIPQLKYTESSPSDDHHLSEISPLISNDFEEVTHSEIFFKNETKSEGSIFFQVDIWPLAQVICLLAYCLVLTKIRSFTVSRLS